MYSRKEKYLPQITLKSSQSSPRIPGNLFRFAIYGGLTRALSQYRAFLALFLVFHQKIVFIIFISFFDEVSNFYNWMLTNEKQEYVIRICQWNCTQELNEVCGNYIWILKWLTLHCNWNWISLISVLSFTKQWVADYRGVRIIQSNI